ncbi:MAG: hypothetical protein IPO66_06510 [Rhodanobacteraceae bacterium]|nr:hypothetical protein [Rhodanobacteraceae bacterium]
MHPQATLYVTWPIDIELRKGDLLLPDLTAVSAAQSPTRRPRPGAGVPENSSSRVIGLPEANQPRSGGPGSFGVISRGAQDGIEVSARSYLIYQPGENIVDEVYPDCSTAGLV